MSNTETPTDRGKAYRLRSVLIFLPFSAITYSTYVGVDAALLGADMRQIEKQMLIALVLMSLLFTLAGVAYIFKPNKFPSLQWRTILAGSAIASLLTAVLYLILRPEAEITLLSPIDDPVLDSAAQFVLVGALHGLLFGGCVSSMVCQLDEKASHFTRQGIVRHAVLAVVVAAVCMICLIIIVSSGTGGFTGLILLFAIPVIRAGIKKWDSRNRESITQ